MVNNNNLILGLESKLDLRVEDLAIGGLGFTLPHAIVFDLNLDFYLNFKYPLYYNYKHKHDSFVLPIIRFGDGISDFLVKTQNIDFIYTAKNLDEKEHRALVRPGFLDDPNYNKNDIHFVKTNPFRYPKTSDLRRELNLALFHEDFDYCIYLRDCINEFEDEALC